MKNYNKLITFLILFGTFLNLQSQNKYSDRKINNIKNQVSQLVEEDKKLTTKKDSKGKPVKYITFVDAPGHEMLMATMLSGAAIMDAAILVVAADEGIKPQTQEHLVALGAKRIKNIIIAQNKIDLVTKEEAKANYDKIKEFVKGTVAENSPIIPISAEQEINLDIILQELIKFTPKQKEESEKPLFVIARSFDINRPGVEVKKIHGGILGGALKKGKLKIGDEIEIKPGYSYKKQNKFYYKTVKSKIISMQKGEHQITEATPGGSLAIETQLDPAITKTDALSGGVLSLKDTLPEITETLKMKFCLFDKVLGTEKHEAVEMLKPSESLMLSINTTISVGVVKSLNKNKDEVELALKIPIVPLKGESVGIARNLNGHWRLIGFGEIV